MQCQRFDMSSEIKLVVACRSIRSNIVKCASIFPSRIDQDLSHVCEMNHTYYIQLVFFRGIVMIFNEWIDVGSYRLTWVVYRSFFSSLHRTRLGRAVARSFSSPSSVCRHTMTCPTTCSSSFSAKTWPTPLETGSLVWTKLQIFMGAGALLLENSLEQRVAVIVAVIVAMRCDCVCGAQSVSNVCYSD